MSHKIELLTALTWTALAGLGGAVRFVAQTISLKERHTPLAFSLLVAANCFVSGFSGLMGALLLSTMTQNHTMHFIAAGMFGYMGIHGLEAIARIFKQKIANGTKS